VTIDTFQHLFVSHFFPAVNHYCKECNIESKALLMLDNAPGHPDNLDILRTCVPVEVVYLAPYTTSLLQPMDQGVISNFKTYYLRCTFKQLVEKTGGEGKQSISQFWKEYIIMNAIDNIRAAWNEVTPNYINGVWKKLWPEACNNFVGVKEESVIQNIVEQVSEAGLEDVNDDGVE
jgi:hypothetical protein